jgi:hypothetical protein
MTTLDQHQANKSASLTSEINIDWVNIIKQWKISGMPQTAYCKANDINYNQFVYQNAKLSVRAAKGSSKLLPVKITHPEKTVTVQNNFVLHYSSGLKLHIPVNAHPEAIKTIINCLEKQQC